MDKEIIDVLTKINRSLGDIRDELREIKKVNQCQTKSKEDA